MRSLHVAILVLAVGTPASAETIAEPAELLREADVATLAPPSFRARFRVVTREASHEVEVWRSGLDRSLVRVLEESEAGKSTSRDGASIWLVTPRARKPVRLGAAMKLRGGAALDFLTGAAYSRDYDVVEAEQRTEDGHLVMALDLRRKRDAPPAQPPRVIYVVDVGRRLPLRIEAYLRGGKRSATLAMSGWSDGRGLPATTRLVDHLQGDATTEVTLLDLEPRDIPASLFDPTDSSARSDLLD